MEHKKANPAPVALLGFGLTTVLLNLHNAGFIPLSIVIVAMGIALGGITQIIGGLLSYKNGNTFAGTAFTAYGFFWISLVIIWVFGPKWNLEADLTSMGFYLLLWGIFTTFMAIGTKNHSLVSKIVFWSLAALFYLLAISDFTGIVLIKQIAGYIGIVAGLMATYDSVAQIVNEELGKEVLPLG